MFNYSGNNWDEHQIECIFFYRKFKTQDYQKIINFNLFMKNKHNIIIHTMTIFGYDWQ